MKKKLKKFLLFPVILCTAAHASLLWEIQPGILEFQKNNFENSKNYFLSYIVNNPENKDGYWYLAQSYSMLGDKKNALKYFKKAYEKTIKERNLEKIVFKDENSENIEDYFDMSSMYFESGNLNEADLYADLMLKIDPKSAGAYFIKAKIAYLKGNKEKAKNFLNQAIFFNNELLNTNLAKNLAVTSAPELSKEMYNLAALEAYFSGKTDEAVKYFKKYLEIDKKAEIYNFLADCYIKQNKLNMAIETISEAEKLFDNNRQILLSEAKIANLTEENDKQEELLLKAHKINPNNPEILLALGNFYLKAKDYKNSKKYFEILTNVDDSLYEAYFGYIYSLIETGELKKAISFTRKAKELNPNSDEILFLLAKICEKEANYTEALEYLTEAAQKTKNPKYYAEMGIINYYLKNYEESLKNFENTPDDEITDEFRIKNYLKTGDLKNAEKYLNKKNSLDKNSIIYKYNLYILYKLQGDENKARALMAQIKKTKPDKIKEFIDLSEIDFEQKSLEAAVKTLDNGIKKYPDSYELYVQKMKLYFLAQNSEKLKEVIEKTQKLFN